jgi:hypothetical protein
MKEKIIEFLKEIANKDDPIGVKVLHIRGGMRESISGFLEGVEIDGEEIVLHFEGGEIKRVDKKYIRSIEIYRTKSGEFRSVAGYVNN